MEGVREVEEGGYVHAACGAFPHFKIFKFYIFYKINFL
jgi:hypothetical protein